MFFSSGFLKSAVLIRRMDSTASETQEPKLQR